MEIGIESGRVNSMNLVDYIIKHDSGECTAEEFVDFYSYLVKTGLAWQFQGSIGRTAVDLIESEILSVDGEILSYELN